MVTIAYGICSEGRGHATRSSLVVDYLQKQGHKVHVFSSDHAYDILQEVCPNMHRIPGFRLIYKGDKLENVRSVMQISKKALRHFLPGMRKIGKRFAKIQPDVIVSDHEAYTSLVGEYLGIPVISVSNISIVDKTYLNVGGLKDQFSKMFTVTAERLANFRANYYVIPTFFFPRTKKPSVSLTAPAVRSEIAKLKPSKGKHVLVYHTTPTMVQLLNVLNTMEGEKFVVYGFGKRQDTKRLTFHEYNQDTFFEHLRTAKAVITGGGFSLISEALYLKKPVLSVPVKEHFEQLTNGYMLRKMKFGDYRINPTQTDVKDFLLKLPFYEHYLNQFSFDPTEYARTIEAKVVSVADQPKSVRMRIWTRLMNQKA